MVGNGIKYYLLTYSKPFFFLLHFESWGTTNNLPLLKTQNQPTLMCKNEAKKEIMI